MAHKYIYLNNDNLVTLTGLKDVAADAFVNNGTVQLTIKNSSDVDVSGITWPLTMDPESGDNGDYAVIVEQTAVFVDEADYVAVVVVSGSGVGDAEWQIPLRASVRRS